MLGDEPRLFADPSTPERQGIDLVLGDFGHALEHRPGLVTDRADLVIADPPWTYSNGGNGSAANHYSTLTTTQIADHMALAWELAAPDAYLALWCTYPLLAEWMSQGHRHPWRYLTGGGWVKPGQTGPGFHWRGNAEAVLVYAKGRPAPRGLVRSGHLEPRNQHSAKPIGWQAEWISGWTGAGDLVLDPYAGIGTVARAALGSGRRYVGFEVDADRHQAARSRVAQALPHPLWRGTFP